MVTMIEELRTPTRFPRCTCSDAMVLQVSDLGQAMWVCEHCHCQHVKTWRGYLDKGEQPQPEASGSSWRSTPPREIAGDIYATDLLAAPIAEAIGELANNDKYDNGVEPYTGQGHDVSWMPGDFTARQAAPSTSIMDCNSAYMHGDQDVTDENYVHSPPDITYVGSDVYVSRTPFSMAGYATLEEHTSVPSQGLGPMDLQMWTVDVSGQAEECEEQAKQFVEPAENYKSLRLRQSPPTQRQVDYIATLAMRLFRDPVIELTAINTKAQASNKIDQLLNELKTHQLNELG